MPAHKSWRDAFEALLALESGGQIVSLEIRNIESEVAKRVWYEGISRNVSFVNDKLTSDAKYLSLFKWTHDFTARKNIAETLAKAIAAKKGFPKQIIAAGKGMIATPEEYMGQSWPASRYQMRGQGMASLVSSGVLTSCYAKIFDSLEGVEIDEG